LLFSAAGTVAAYSALLGGLICVIPNAWFAGRLLRKSGPGDSRAFLSAAYVGEAGKLIITAALFALVFSQVRPLHAPALFVAFVACLMTNWIGLIFIGRGRTEGVRPNETNFDRDSDGE